jgi:hypothetical protein
VCINRVVLITLVYGACAFVMPLPTNTNAGTIPATQPAAVVSVYEGFLYTVSIGGRWGFIDQRGKVVIPPQYVSIIQNFGNDGFAVAVITRNPDHPLGWGRMGIINRRGETVLEANAIAALGRGRFFLRDDGNVRFVGLIDPFSTALACTPESLTFNEGLLAVRIGEKCGFLDELGNLAIKPMCDRSLGFEDGLAPARLGEKWGFIDHGGNWAIRPQYDSAYYFRGGVAFVGDGMRQFYIDRNGQQAIAADFARASSFSEGLASVTDAQSGLAGYIDSSGKYRIAPQFKIANPFSEGLAYVETGDDQNGYIDHSGQFVIKLPPISYYMTDFQNGLAPVNLDKKHGYINKAGDWVWSVTEDDR